MLIKILHKNYKMRRGQNSNDSSKIISTTASLPGPEHEAGQLSEGCREQGSSCWQHRLKHKWGKVFTTVIRPCWYINKIYGVLTNRELVLWTQTSSLHPPLIRWRSKYQAAHFHNDMPCVTLQLTLRSCGHTAQLTKRESRNLHTSWSPTAGAGHTPLSRAHQHCRLRGPSSTHLAPLLPPALGCWASQTKQLGSRKQIKL